MALHSRCVSALHHCKLGITWLQNPNMDNIYPWRTDRARFLGAKPWHRQELLLDATSSSQSKQEPPRPDSSENLEYGEECVTGESHEERRETMEKVLLHQPRHRPLCIVTLHQGDIAHDRMCLGWKAVCFSTCQLCFSPASFYQPLRVKS